MAAHRVVRYDPALNDTARVLAGMLPETPGRYAAVTSRPSWQAYHASMDAEWSRDASGRRAVMSAWRDRELADVNRQCGVLLYPFGGPDMLNAYELFPSCETYVLFGLEHLGRVPALDGLTPERADRLVSELDESLSDLFTRHYFITSRMMSELAGSDLDGVVSLFLLVLARLDAHVLAADRVALGADGSVGATPAAAPASRVPAGQAAPLQGAPRDAPVVAWRIRFVTGDGTHPQSMIYFRAQAENRGLEHRPVVEAYLRSLAPATTFLKSASYLLHDPQFSAMRSVILDTSRAILQDDSGVPYRFIAPPEWRVTLFGQYARPVRDFNYGYQRDLESAYDAAASSIRPLPFSYGYHWRDDSPGAMLAQRTRARGSTASP